jgi:acetyl esterase/lipase
VSIDRRSLLSGLLAAAALPVVPRAEPAQEWPLWPEGALLRRGPRLTEQIVDAAADPRVPDRTITGIVRPRLRVYPAQQPIGAAALIVPGGGYRRLVLDREAGELAGWLQVRGVASFVLLHRLPGDGWVDAADAPLADAQRAMRLIRQSAAAQQIDAARIAVIGFSAGGHVAAELACGFDRTLIATTGPVDELPARPCAAALLYPVVSMQAGFTHAASRERLLGPRPAPAMQRLHSVELQVRRDAPGHFLLHAADDAVVSAENTMTLATALRTAAVPVQLHLFERGGHGFGIAGAAAHAVRVWPELLWEWGKLRSWL